MQDPAGCGDIRIPEQRAIDQGIHDGGRFRSGSTRDPVEPGLLLRLELARAFRRVERDRSCCAPQLVSQIGLPAWQLTQQPLDLTRERSGQPVYLEVILIEQHLALLIVHAGMDTRPSGAQE
jgi:hypothetical protein